MVASLYDSQRPLERTNTPNAVSWSIEAAGRERDEPPDELRIGVRNKRDVIANGGVGFIDWLGHGRCELECDSIANSISAAILRRPLEPPNEDTAVNFNDSAGSSVVWVRRDFDVFQPL